MESDDERGPTAPDVVERHAHELVEQSRQIVADRFAESRFDPDRGLRVTVVDLTDQDTAAITRLGERLGIAGWVRIERADPAALDAWERLRHSLLALRNAEPGVLEMYPTPDPGYRRPPVRIHLAAHAERTAADLHDVYGDFVSLHVGALPYPPRPDLPTRRRPAGRGDQPDTVSPSEMRIVLDGPLSLRTGQSTTHALLLTNLGDADVEVHTNGHLTASIVDDVGAAIGGFSGAQHQPLAIFTAGPSDTVRIPVLVGTASYTPALGYVVPPGVWQLTAPMTLGDGRHLVTPALELTITD